MCAHAAFACAGILAVEAYHAGIIRTLLYQQRDTETPYNITVADLVQAISALRASVGGGADQGIVEDTANGEVANIVPADTTTSLAFARTPAEVWHFHHIFHHATTYHGLQSI